MSDLSIFPDLPTKAWNNSKTQHWDTVVKKYGGGRRKALSRQAYPDWTIDCAFTCLDPSQLNKAKGFFAKVHGQQLPFLWLDPEDYHEEKAQIGIGDGITTDFQLVRRFDEYFTEPVLDIVSGTLVAFADDQPVTVLGETEGLVKLSAPPAEGKIITATFDYYWRVAFDDEELEWEYFWYNFYKINKFKLVSVR